MTRARRTPPQRERREREPLRLRQPRATVEERLKGQIERGKTLAQRGVSAYSDSEFDEWLRDRNRWGAFTEEVLVSAFDGDGPREEFEAAIAPPSIGFISMGPETVAERQQRIETARERVLAGANALQSLVERLELVSDGEPQRTFEQAEPSPATGKVFVVHGRDEGLRDQVARVVTALGLEPVILAEQANEGLRPLLEKFESNADVAFAVVILAPDDFARGPDEVEWPAQPNRARQNVILELGYFIGRLGRHRVAALYREGTELPSDILGVGYVGLDGTAWRFELGRELKAAGFDVDLNDLA